MKILKEEKKEITNNEITDEILSLISSVRKLTKDMGSLTGYEDCISLCNEFNSKLTPYLKMEHNENIKSENINVSLDMAKDRAGDLKDVMQKTEQEVTLTEEIFSARELLELRKIEALANKHGYIVESIYKK